MREPTSCATTDSIAAYTELAKQVTVYSTTGKTFVTSLAKVVDDLDPYFDYTIRLRNVLARLGGTLMSGVFENNHVELEVTQENVDDILAAVTASRVLE